MAIKNEAAYELLKTKRATDYVYKRLAMLVDDIENMRRDCDGDTYDALCAILRKAQKADEHAEIALALV